MRARSDIMQFSRHYRKIFVYVAAGMFLACSLSVGSASEGEGNWDKAGKEVKEAAGAVADATMYSSRKAWNKTKEESQELYEKAKEESEEAWDKTMEKSDKTWKTVKEESSEAWEKTKDASKEAYDTSKDKIHEATAPDTSEEKPSE